MLLWLLYVIFWLPGKILLPTKVVNKKLIPKKGGVVLACNHFSNLDVILLQLNIGRGLKYLAKKELMKNKFVGWFLKKLGAFPVDRENGDIAATKFALKTLKDGKALCMFPEGTRNKSDSNELQDLKSGAVLFASKTSSPLVPMMFVSKPRLFHKSYLIVGEPVVFNFIDPNRPSKSELNEAVAKLSQIMKNLQNSHLKNIDN